MIVRSLDGGVQSAVDDSMMGAHDTAVATAEDSSRSSMAATAQIRDPLAEIVGSTLSGRYLVTRKVGQGGMGAVYEATHTLINKRVAVKVLLEKYAQREAIVARLKQEAQLASSVGNEHIIDITDFGTTEDGRTFVVMEFLEGESMAECLARETKLSEQRILRIVSQASSALVAAHDKGVVHRDIKPENLFLLKRKEQDFVKVVDFGISKSLRASSEEEAPRLTQTGMVLGTPLYMSPEQARGDDELDHRVDIYAIGVIMYEASTGRVPFLGNNYLSVISQVLNEEPKPLRELRPELSEEFEAIVLRAMAKDRRDRYKDATELVNDITALLDDPTRSTERAKILGPRRHLQRPKGGLKLVVWIAAVSVIVAAIVFTVVVMMGGTKKASISGSDAGVGLVTPPIAPLDAGVAPADAAVIPEADLLEVKVDSKPQGATIVLGGLDKCVTPCSIKVTKTSKEVSGFAKLEGYDDYPFNFNPIEIKDKPQFSFKLVKPKPGAPIRKLPIPKVDEKRGSGAAGSGSAAPNRTGGELTGSPFPGTVPKK